MDLIYEGITTFQLDRWDPDVGSVRMDLIYEGITTAVRRINL